MARRVIEHVHDTAGGVYRLLVEHEDGVEDFVWVADDERWSGLSEEDVARQQREIVAAALDERRNARRHAVMPTPLPGAGEEF